MKHASCSDGRDHLTTPDDEVTLDDVRRFEALAARTPHTETRDACLNLIRDFYRQHPPAAKKGNAA